MNGFRRETFEGLETSNKLNVIFDILVSFDERLTTISTNCPSQYEKCAKRFDVIEKKKWVNTAASAVGGFFGGVAAVIGKFIFFKDMG